MSTDQSGGVSDDYAADEPSVAFTLTEASNCSVTADGGVSGGGGSSDGYQGGDGTASPELSEAMVASPNRPSVKPESVLLPPRLAQLALKRGDTRMNMALGGVGRQIERKKQHRFATYMTSLEDRIRADIALAFSEQDPGTGAVDEPQLKLTCASVLAKIDRLLRDAPDFQQARFEVKHSDAVHGELLEVQRGLTRGTAQAAGADAPSRWNVEQVTLMILHWLKQKINFETKKGKKRRKGEWSLRNVLVAVFIMGLIVVAISVAVSGDESR